MVQLGFFDRRGQVHHRISDPLHPARGVSVKSTRRLAERHYGWRWERFRIKPGGSDVDAKGYDVIPPREILISRSLYNLSNFATEFQIPSRHSFVLFLASI